MAHLGARKRQHVTDDVVDVHRILAWRTLRRQLPDALDHFRRPVTVHRDRFECFPDGFEVGTRGRQPVEGGIGIGDDGGQGLVDLVSDRRGQLAQRGHAGDVRELRLRFLQGFLGLDVLGDIAADDECRLHPLRVWAQR